MYAILTWAETGEAEPPAGRAGAAGCLPRALREGCGGHPTSPAGFQFLDALGRKIHSYEM